MAASFDEIATMRIEMVDSEPLIWREAEVPTSSTLKALHNVIQGLFGWSDYHLWEFTVRGQAYGPPMAADDPPRRDAAKIRLRDILDGPVTVFAYLYDFGDCWEHRITVSDIRPGDPGGLYPRFTGGAQNAPPEDCGGLPGFYELLAAREDPRHPDHDEAADLLEGYDPDAVDEFLIGVALRRVARRRLSGAGSSRQGNGPNRGG